MCIHTSQHHTDHHELPPTMNKALENLPVKTNKVSQMQFINSNLP